MGKGKKPLELQLIIKDLLVDSKAGTTRAGTVEFDADNLDINAD